MTGPTRAALVAGFFSVLSIKKFELPFIQDEFDPWSNALSWWEQEWWCLWRGNSADATASLLSMIGCRAFLLERYMRRQTLLVFLPLLTACATAPSTKTDVADTLELAMQLQRVQGSNVTAIPPLGTVHNGERLRIALDSSLPAFAYVFLRTSSGRVDPLFPISTETLLRPGQGIVIPSEGKSMEVLGDVGQQQIVVLASRQSLCRTDATHPLARELCKGLASGTDPTVPTMQKRGTEPAAADKKEKEPEKKQPISVGNRGGAFVEQGRYVQRSKSDGPSLIELTVAIQVEQ